MNQARDMIPTDYSRFSEHKNISSKVVVAALGISIGITAMTCLATDLSYAYADTISQLEIQRTARHKKTTQTGNFVFMYDDAGTIEISRAEGKNASFTDKDADLLQSRSMKSQAKRITFKDNIQLETKFRKLFLGMSKLEYVDVSNVDFSKLTNLSDLFRGCENLTTIKSNNPTFSDKLIDTQRMFKGCKKLTSTSAQEFIKNLTMTGVESVSLDSMFQDCESIRALDLSHLKPKTIYGMGYMFSGCKNLTYLDISGLDLKESLSGLDDEQKKYKFQRVLYRGDEDEGIQDTIHLAHLKLPAHFYLTGEQGRTIHDDNDSSKRWIVAKKLISDAVAMTDKELVAYINKDTQTDVENGALELSRADKLRGTRIFDAKFSEALITSNSAQATPQHTFDSTKVLANSADVYHKHETGTSRHTLIFRKYSVATDGSITQLKPKFPRMISEGLIHTGWVSSHTTQTHKPDEEMPVDMVSPQRNAQDAQTWSAVYELDTKRLNAAEKVAIADLTQPLGDVELTKVKQLLLKHYPLRSSLEFKLEDKEDTSTQKRYIQVSIAGHDEVRTRIERTLLVEKRSEPAPAPAPAPAPSPQPQPQPQPQPPVPPQPAPPVVPPAPPAPPQPTPPSPPVVPPMPPAPPQPTPPQPQPPVPPAPVPEPQPPTPIPPVPAPIPPAPPVPAPRPNPAPQQQDNKQDNLTLWRLYNPYTGEHLFTTKKSEQANLVALGWRDEGAQGMASAKEGNAVYRLYNPWTGEHHYTMDRSEVDACVPRGWKDEGIAFYSVGTRAVFSMYNPYEKAFYHHYTSDEKEIAQMIKAGWMREGVKWYVK